MNGEATWAYGGRSRENAGGGAVDMYNMITAIMLHVEYLLDTLIH